MNIERRSHFFGDMLSEERLTSTEDLKPLQDEEIEIEDYPHVWANGENAEINYMDCSSMIFE